MPGLPRTTDPRAATAPRVAAPRRHGAAAGFTRLALVVVALAVSLPLYAQTVANTHAWAQLMHEHRLDTRWSLFGDLQVRRAESGAAPQQLLLRPGILFTISPALRLGAGYAYVETERYGAAPTAVPFPEHRIWQQLVASTSTGDVAWQGRLRTEQRWIGATRVTPSGQVEVTDWRYRQRLRPMVRASVNAPSFGIDAPRLYLTGWNELFLHVGEQVNGETLDQNRSSLQIGWRFSPRVRLEAGYLHQFIRRGAPGTSESNHTLLLTLSSISGAP